MNGPVALLLRTGGERPGLDCDKHAEIVCGYAGNHAEILLALIAGAADGLPRKPAGRACLHYWNKSSCASIMQNGTIPSNFDRHRLAKFRRITSLLKESRWDFPNGNFCFLPDFPVASQCPLGKTPLYKNAEKQKGRKRPF